MSRTVKQRGHQRPVVELPDPDDPTVATQDDAEGCAAHRGIRRVERDGA